MTDKVLKEAFDKLKAIEEGERDDDAPKGKNYGKVGYGGDWDGVAGGPKDYEGEDENDRRWESNVEEDRSGDDARDGIEEFTDIQDELFEMIERLDSAIRAYQPRQHKYWQSYGLAHLKQIAGSDEYASSDRNINTLIQDLKDELHGGEAEPDEDERTQTRHAGRPDPNDTW